MTNMFNNYISCLFNKCNLINTKRGKIILVIVILILVFLITRIPLLSRDEINPDGVNWHYRSQQFIVGLKSGDFLKTYQHYHPGVTLMWIMGIPVEMYKQITGINTYDMYNFEDFHLIAKCSIVFVQLLLHGIIFFLLANITGYKKAWYFSLLLLLEPFFVGNSRILHMDVLFTLFIFITLLLLYHSLRKGKSIWIMLSGMFIALSFLTKSIGIGLLPFGVLYIIIYFILEKKTRFITRYLLLLFLSFTATVFLVFPAMWVKPSFVIQDIFSESERVGVRKGHTQIIMGEETENAGFHFYPLVLAVKVSPFIQLGVFTYLLLVLIKYVKQRKINDGSLFLYLSIFYIGYLLVMSFPSKKIDRYMVPLFPYLVYMAVEGYYIVFNKIVQRKKTISILLLFILFISFVIIPNINLFPYLFTYTNPLFGSPDKANKIIAQKPFGMGIFEVKDKIMNKYALYGSKDKDNYPKLGFIDIKPIEAIYPNSKVFNIRETGLGSYDYVVLGVNENLTEEMLNDSRYTLEKDLSFYINGLEYWRVYVKKPR